MKFSPLAWAQKNADKVAHAACSFAMMTFFSLVLLDFTFGYLISFVVTMGIGLLKEWHDATSAGGSGWSNADIVADLVGTVASLVLVISTLGF